MPSQKFAGAMSRDQATFAACQPRTSDRPSEDSFERTFSPTDSQTTSPQDNIKIPALISQNSPNEKPCTYRTEENNCQKIVVIICADRDKSRVLQVAFKYYKHLSRIR
jgi:hypothetical protein